MSNNRKLNGLQNNIPTPDTTSGVEEIINQAKTEQIKPTESKTAKTEPTVSKKLVRRFGLAVDQETYDAFSDLAWRRRVSVNKLLNQIIRDYLNANRE